MLSKISWWSVLLGALFAMFVWPMISAKFASARGAQSTRTA